MAELKQPGDCSHANVVWRHAGNGIPINALWCLDCGAAVTGERQRARKMIGPLMDPSALDELRARLNWNDPKPASMRVGEEAWPRATHTNIRDGS